tara:strand:- start:188 stop:412 length:225 start_codon:yes stop_codon:yes gene_type:complete
LIKDNINVKLKTMKHIPKKEFNRFYTIMKNNPGNSVLENHVLYAKELAREEAHAKSLEANVGIWTKEFITNKIK